MNRSSKDMYASAGAVAVAVVPCIGLARSLYGSKRAVRRAAKSLLFGGMAGGAFGGALGVADSVFNPKSQQPKDLLDITGAAAAIGAVVSLGTSLTVDAVLRRRWRPW